MFLRALLVLLPLLAVCFTATHAQDQYCGVDIVFLVDSSGSVGSINFAKTMDFVYNVVNGLAIGPDDVRIGLIRFASSSSPQFHLDSYTTKQDVLSHVRRTYYSGGGTATHSALAYARQTSFTSAKGMRANAAQVAIVITDGYSNSYISTIREAEQLRDKGVTVFSIGVGRGPKLSELYAMASDPDSSHVFQVDDFNALSLILNALQNGSCQADAANLCGGQADIVFLLDESGRVGSGNFAKMLQFVEDVAKQFIVGPGDIQVGLDTFSSGLSHEFYLRQVRNQVDLRNLLSRVSYSGGSTNTAYAIRRMRLESFTSSAGHRSNVPKIAILVTGGESVDKTQTSSEARVARDNGIIMIAVGVGQYADDAELKAIASDPDSQNVHKAAAFDALSGLETTTAATACAIVESPNIVCGTRADIVFLIDTSGSVGPDNFKRLLNFINTFVKDLEIGQNNIRVGIAKFGSRPYDEFNLNRFDNKTDLMRAIDNIGYNPDGGADFTAAIGYMRNNMFSSASGNRPGIPDLAVILTDGQSNRPDETKVAAERARASGITIFTVGVGDDAPRSALNEIATDPDSSHVLTVKDFTKLNAIISSFQNQICREIPTILPPYMPPPTLPPTPLPDPCQDAISNCAAYDQSACTNYPAWATTFCSKTCGICSPSTPVVAPPCVDNLSNCSNYDASSCSGNTSWATENCRKFCGYCSPGTQVGGFFNKCFYKGREYAQGEKWDDGCAYECECADANTGKYVCYNKCPSYYNLPSQCPLVQQQGACCLKPVCTFDGTYVTNDTTGACVYNGQSYLQGQIWSVGCQSHCFCLNATAGEYACQSRCAKYDSLPSNCKLVKRPGGCCEKPVCEFQTQIGVVTGNGGTSGPGGNSTTPGVCIHRGQVHNQDDTWQDGCGTLCLCENATYGYVRCQNLCPNFLNIPTNCSLVTVFGNCCQSLYCTSPATFDSSQTGPDTTGGAPDQVTLPGNSSVPTLPPGITYAPGQDPNTTPVLTPVPSPTGGISIVPPILTCGPAEEGQSATLTCDADLASCPNLFVVDWSADRGELAKCTSTTCDGSFTKMAGVDVTMTATGSTMTLQNVTRGSSSLTTRWACEFCGGSPVTCDKFETYVRPENPTCSVSDDTDPASGELLSVDITCSTSRVYPTALCSFERRTNGGQSVPITTQPSYSHSPTGETPVHYVSQCSVSVAADELGVGINSFQAYIYPDVINGKNVVSATVAAETVDIVLPENPACTVSGVTEPVSGATVSVNITCSTSRVSPSAECSFERRKDSGQFVPITAQPSYSHSSAGGSQCSVSVAVDELGMGIHSFQGYIYPNVVDGKNLVNVTVAAETFDLVLPENPTCTVSEVIDPVTGAVASVNVTISTSSVSPAGECTFERRKNSGQFVPITAQPSYSHSSTGGSQCSVSVAVDELGMGIHSFQGYIYPNVVDGKNLVNVTVAAETVNLFCKPDAKRDIFFLLDTQDSVGADNFELGLNFVEEIVNAFKISPDTVRIGLSTLSRSATRFFLKDYDNKADVLASVETIPYSGGISVTNSALRFVRRWGFHTRKGGRVEAPSYLILLTNERSTFPEATEREAALMAQEDITVFAVGVGNSTDMMTELNLVASPPSLALNVRDFQALSDTWVDVVTDICKEPVDGQWSVWGSWSECTKPCGGGEQSRNRTCTSPAPSNGGKKCKGSSTSTQTCNEGPCIIP